MDRQLARRLRKEGYREDPDSPGRRKMVCLRKKPMRLKVKKKMGVQKLNRKSRIMRITKI